MAYTPYSPAQPAAPPPTGMPPPTPTGGPEVLVGVRRRPGPLDAPGCLRGSINQTNRTVHLVGVRDQRRPERLRCQRRLR